MNLIHKTNEELLTALKTLRDQEIRSQIDILWHLHEVQRREIRAPWAPGGKSVNSVKLLFCQTSFHPKTQERTNSKNSTLYT